MLVDAVCRLRRNSIDAKDFKPQHLREGKKWKEVGHLLRDTAIVAKVFNAFFISSWIFVFGTGKH
jgi:hypothetical protein